MKSWKILVHLATLVLITFPPVSTYNQDLISNEDIDETTGLLIEYITPMFEEKDLDIEDFPDLLKALISRFYIIFSRAEDPLDTLEKMRKDYEMIKNNHRIDKKEYEVFTEDFVEYNSVNDEFMIEQIVTNLLDFLNSWEDRLQVIAPREAVKFLLYEETYPDIMELVGLMVQQHYKTYKEGIQFRREDIENYKDDQNTEDTENSDDTEDADVTDKNNDIENSEDIKDDEKIENSEEIVKSKRIEDEIEQEEEEDIESVESNEDEYDWDSEFNDEL